MRKEFSDSLPAGLADSSGILVMRYEDFVSGCTGAKDTWGVNYFQIEGEDGFIYIEDGSNGLARVRVATKTSDETFNMQDDPDRYIYEMRGIAKMFLQDDQALARERLAVSLDVMEVLEKSRQSAGISFPGDE